MNVILNNNNRVLGQQIRHFGATKIDFKTKTQKTLYFNKYAPVFNITLLKDNKLLFLMKMNLKFLDFK